MPPLAYKGKRYDVEICIVAWLDLLGYGAQLAEVGFNPTSKEALKAVQRLTAFQRLLAAHAGRHFRALAINDGAAISRDLSDRSRSNTFDFLQRAFDVFSAINKSEKQRNEPGARMVVAAGPRLRMDEAKAPNVGHRDSLLRRLNEGTINSRHAVYESFRSSPLLITSPILQANFAFTKAYLVDSAGSRAGFGGANLFLESLLFSETSPDWLHSDATIEWSSHGMASKFYRVMDLDFTLGGKQMQSGVRRGDEIAHALKISRKRY